MKAWLKTAFVSDTDSTSIHKLLSDSPALFPGDDQRPSKVNVTLEQRCERNCSQTLHWL